MDVQLVNFDDLDLMSLPTIDIPNGLRVGSTEYVEQDTSIYIPEDTEGKFRLPGEDNRWVFITRKELIFQRYVNHRLLMTGKLNNKSGTFATIYSDS